MHGTNEQINIIGNPEFMNSVVALIIVNGINIFSHSIIICCSEFLVFVTPPLFFSQAEKSNK